LTLPPPVLTCGELAGACSPSWLLDELLLLEPVESPASPDELEPGDELLLVDELLVELLVDELPVTPLGKIDRRALTARTTELAR